MKKLSKKKQTEVMTEIIGILDKIDNPSEAVKLLESIWLMSCRKFDVPYTTMCEEMNLLLGVYKERVIEDEKSSPGDYIK